MSADVRIVPFDPAYRGAFARLNYAWITTLLAVEPPDQRILDNPEQEIIAHGGEIFLRCMMPKWWAQLHSKWGVNQRWS